MKPSGILNFENVPADAGDPDVKVYVNGSEVEIGGGSSDFTTAAVTLANSTGDLDDIVLAAPFIVEGEISIMPDVTRGHQATLEIVLYKGSLVCTVTTDDNQMITENITTTGAIEDLGGGYLQITGDGTITVGA